MHPAMRSQSEYHLHLASPPNQGIAAGRSRCRIVNSTMLAVDEPDEINQEQQQEFVATEKISQKV